MILSTGMEGAQPLASCLGLLPSPMLKDLTYTAVSQITFVVSNGLFVGQAFMFRKYSYKETKKATENFSTVIGEGGFGTVYRARFSDDSMAAVKRMNMVSEQGEDDFCREIELLARLHHRHLVALKGFCVEKRER